MLSIQARRATYPTLARNKPVIGAMVFTLGFFGSFAVLTLLDRHDGKAEEVLPAIARRLTGNAATSATPGAAGSSAQAAVTADTTNRGGTAAGGGTGTATPSGSSAAGQEHDTAAPSGSSSSPATSGGSAAPAGGPTGSAPAAGSGQTVPPASTPAVPGMGAVSLQPSPLTVLQPAQAPATGTECLCKTVQSASAAVSAPIVP